MRNVKIEIAQAYSSFELIIFRKRYERKLSIARHILVPQQNKKVAEKKLEFTFATFIEIKVIEDFREFREIPEIRENQREFHIGGDKNNKSQAES